MKKLSIIVMLFALMLLSACSEAGVAGEWETVFSKEGEDYYYYVDMVSLELKKDNTAESESFDMEMRGPSFNSHPYLEG